MLTIERKTFKQSSKFRIGLIRALLLHLNHLSQVREYTPNVIEPSFGLGRILYTLLEHSFWSREMDVERGVSISLPHIHPRRVNIIRSQVLSLPPIVAPTKVLIVPLSAREEFDPLVREVCASPLQ
jgi:glycyl-tRNA synthetase